MKPRANACAVASKKKDKSRASPHEVKRMQSNTDFNPNSDGSGSSDPALSSTPSKSQSDISSVTETGGESFESGMIIELIRDVNTGGLQLLLAEGKASTVTPKIHYKDREYIPPKLDIGTLRAVTFPHGLSDFRSTADLFTEVRQSILEFGFAEDVALIGASFLFSSWFPDCLPLAPRLLVEGPSAEANLFFQLLGCFARRALQLSAFNLSDLHRFLLVQPTLLVRQPLTPARLRSLLSLIVPGAYIPVRNGLAQWSSAMVIYAGDKFHKEAVPDDFLRVNLTPIRRKLPILDSSAGNALAEQFQPRLLSYRLQNLQNVKTSTCDFPWLRSELRVFARILGACIVDALEPQSDLVRFFQKLQDENREHSWLDDKCVAVEAALAHCHTDTGDGRLYVGKLAETANLILKGRGSSKTIESLTMGGILRELGFSPKRNSKGYSISLTSAIRYKIHELAFELDVAGMLAGKKGCADCTDVLGATGPSETDRADT